MVMLNSEKFSESMFPSFFPFTVIESLAIGPNAKTLLLLQSIRRLSYHHAYPISNHPCTLHRLGRILWRAHPNDGWVILWMFR
jgi:hypothetical protein